MKAITVNFVPSLGLPPKRIEPHGEKSGYAPHAFIDADNIPAFGVGWRVWCGRNTYVYPTDRVLSIEVED